MRQGRQGLQLQVRLERGSRQQVRQLRERRADVVAMVAVRLVEHDDRGAAGANKQAVCDYLGAQTPEARRAAMNLDPSYVFFQLEPIRVTRMWAPAYACQGLHAGPSVATGPGQPR